MINFVRTEDNMLFSKPNGWPEEIHVFATFEAANKRATFINEALTWVGTPFVNCGDIKGLGGAVDCGMMLVRSTVDTGLLPRFDPRPYSPDHMVHSDEQFFLGWVQDKLGGVEVSKPRVGDVVIWQFGRSFCHGAILLNTHEYVHAFKAEEMCCITRADTPLLCFLPKGQPRPVKYFDLFGG